MREVQRPEDAHGVGVAAARRDDYLDTCVMRSQESGHVARTDLARSSSSVPSISMAIIRMAGAARGISSLIVHWLLRLRSLGPHWLPAIAADRYTLKEEPQPQVLLTAAFSNLNPAASRVST